MIKLGVLRKLGNKIPDLLVGLCHDGLARYGTVANTLIEVNERVLFLGRLCKACKVAPGYVTICRTLAPLRHAAEVWRKDASCRFCWFFFSA